MTNENQAVDHTREELKQQIHDYFVLGLSPRHKDDLLAIADKLEREALAASKDDLLALSEPEPPSLKEQALEQLREVNAMLQFQTTGGETSAIRRALETLPND